MFLSLISVLKEMKALDKEVRVWDVYMGLESTVKNLLTSLRAVNELQNSAVRERHWQQLMNTTRVQYFTVQQLIHSAVATSSHLLSSLHIFYLHSAVHQHGPRLLMTCTAQ